MRARRKEEQPAVQSFQPGDTQLSVCEGSSVKKHLSREAAVASSRLSSLSSFCNRYPVRFKRHAYARRGEESRQNRHRTRKRLKQRDTHPVCPVHSLLVELARPASTTPPFRRHRQPTTSPRDAIFNPSQDAGRQRGRCPARGRRNNPRPPKGLSRATRQEIQVPVLCSCFQ